MPTVLDPPAAAFGVTHISLNRFAAGFKIVFRRSGKG
jgi:hypothetical protein